MSALAGDVPAAHPALLRQVRSALIAAGASPTPTAVAEVLRAQGRVVGDSAALALVDELRAELAGAGPLDDLLQTPGVTDVLVNAPDEVWFDRGGGLERAAARFSDDASVRRLAQRLATVAGRRLDDASPFVDARLPGGVRLHAVLPPVSPRGTLLSFRTMRAEAFTLDELLRAGTVTEELREVLAALVAARVSFVVTGGTGSGKTTLLAALLGLVRRDERIVLVEDSGELAPAHPHVVRLESRPANVEGAGAVSLRDLVRQALRMRPDRLVVGEVRGAEVVELLAALNTGHEGGCGTLHANSAADVPARIEALGVAAGLDRLAIHSQLAAGVRAVVQLAPADRGVRRVEGVHLLRRDRSGLVESVAALTRDGPGPLHRDLQAMLR